MSRGRYERMHRIASGGISSVHLGRKRGEGGFERLVALKTLHPELTQDRSLVQGFLDQARIAARVRHPNVVSVVDVEAEGSDVQLVMEYVEGTSLEKLVASSSAAGTPIPVAATLRLMHDVLAGLQAIHDLEGPGGVALGVVHYNLTPRSILVGTDGNTRITDLGVDPNHVASRPSPDERRLRATYSAPEVLQGLSADARSDIFSIGVVLWELLANRDHPSAEGGRRSVASAPSRVNTSLPRAFDDVCLRALEEDPKQRFASAVELSYALTELADATGIRMASPAVVAHLVQNAEDEQPTRMKGDADEVLASASFAGSVPPEMDTVRGPLETVPLDIEGDDPGTMAPRSEMGTVRMEWPSAEGSVRDSDSDMRTVMAPVMHAPRAPIGQPLSSVPPAQPLSTAPPVQPLVGEVPLAPLPVFEDDSTPVPAGLERRSGGTALKYAGVAGALIVALTIGWFVRELVGGDDTPVPSAATSAAPIPAVTATATATADSTSAPTTAATVAATTTPSVEAPVPTAAPVPSPPQRPPPQRPPPRRPPPPRGNSSIIRDAPF